MQAYTGASDAEAIEALIMDRRWQLVLDCIDCENTPFSQATLVRFRTALIIQGLDRRLIERTVELAEQTKGFGSRQLRAALDSSPLWGASLTVYCKAWQVRNGKLFTKTAFTLDWDNQTICCPNQVTLPFAVGGKVQFPKHICASCPLRESCTTSRTGRSVSIHPDEPLFQELKQRQLTPAGRAKLRERVAVEHSLSHIGRWQGDQARYVGTRKNLFDLRRTAVVHNLHVLAKIFTNTTEQSCTLS
ncbi:Transposase, IS5 family (plasmid) [Nostoc flagelliforme CCNUN1]|uniref:Transposase, IS5 family n=1 Tax=Nostoc flagelliforme CCNUN1 TaxID=2038116 RepID=A0A2K8T8C1_9NOSO|nr:Transposase, IS5 family [Nostoc flagelliforme CCNUN1]